MMRDFANQKSLLKESATNQRQRSGDQLRRDAPDDKPRRYGRWLLLAIIVLVIVMIIVVKHATSPQQKTMPSTPQNTASKTQPAQGGDGKSPTTSTNQVANKPPEKKPNKPVFDFYTVLPKQKAQPETTQPAGGQGQQASQVAQSNKQFTLQVASYQSEQLAQQLRSQLILLGLKPTIVSTQSGWYRIDVGPYDSMRAADKVRHQLQNSGINGAMIRQGQ